MHTSQNSQLSYLCGGLKAEDDKSDSLIPSKADSQFKLIDWYESDHDQD